MMEACVIAIGPFTLDIANFLEYDAEYYDNVKPGTTVITTLFPCNTRQQSQTLAEALGMEPFDFNTHTLVFDTQVCWQGLADLSATTEWNLSEVERFKALLRCKGFTFIYMPNA